MGDMQQARQYLRRYAEARRQIEQLYARARVFRDRALSITAQLSDMPRSDSPNLQRNMDMSNAAMDLEAEAAEKRKALTGLRDEMAAQISRLEDHRERDVLVSRYLDEMTWEECQAALSYSKPYLYEIHRDALTHLAAMLPDEIP